jgi:hypothetical protein
MANVKISNLTAATTPVAGTEVLPIVQSGSTVKVSIANLTPGLDTITAAKGGTGQTSYAVGDLLYASTTTALSKLADVATGNALISGGVSTAPSWGKIGLTTHVSGTLPTANGGTNLTSFTSGGVVYASSTSALTTGSALVFNGTSLGVGVTPSVQYSGIKSLQVGSTTNLFDNGASTKFYHNAYTAAAGDETYLTTGYAQGYLMASNGQHQWYTAASGTAGNTFSFTQAMTLDASGQLGVGTTSPNERLTINSASAGSARIGVQYNGSAIALLGSYSGIVGSGNATDMLIGAANVLAFASGGAGTERARIDSSGNLLVGTTTAVLAGKIVSVASGNQTAIALRNSTAAYASCYAEHTVNSSTGYAAYFTNTGSGTGLYISNTAAWQSTSDERLKTDIQDLDSTARLLQLRPVDYLWKSQLTSDEPNKRNLGFIAQEVKDVFPELVGVAPDGMFSVEYTGLIAPLVKAIQEQQALITQLQADVAALKGA